MGIPLYMAWTGHAVDDKVWARKLFAPIFTITAPSAAMSLDFKVLTELLLRLTRTKPPGLVKTPPSRVFLWRLKTHQPRMQAYGRGQIFGKLRSLQTKRILS